VTVANPVFVAIDRPDLDGAVGLTSRLVGHVGGVKLGLEFFAANGAGGVRRVAEFGLPIFLDLKLHDIPNTVAGAMRHVARLPVAMVTIHGSGGRAMIEAAVEAAGNAGATLQVLVVTVLTSLDDQDLAMTGVSSSVSEQALRIARLAVSSGAGGLICAPQEIATLRASLGNRVKLVVPGIRPGAASDDQKRTMTPSEAMNAGADHLVIGRPITQASDPLAAADAITAMLA